MKRALIAVTALALIFGIIGFGICENSQNSKNSGLDQLKTAQADTEYHGNVSSKIFHGPDCRYYDCKNCTAIFNTREEAINSGYRPCKICKP